jgi:hypothetical protein
MMPAPRTITFIGNPRAPGRPGRERPGGAVGLDRIFGECASLMKQD